MTLAGEFSKETVDLLAKRAALHCSNPDCGVLTSAPTVSIAGAINIGEAAHIYGRTEKSKRYNQILTNTERSDITNGIWLCRNCHKEIDNDEPRFPAELLFEWRRGHEQMVLERLGLKSDLIRNKLKTDHLKVFEGVSYLAHQIAYDHPPYWEYKLTLEILRKELAPVHTRWLDLKNGLYVRKSTLINFDELSFWWRGKFDYASKIIQALAKLVDHELKKSWGEPGVPGNDLEILRISRLLVSAASNLLEWEEDIRFTIIPEEFSDALSAVQGIAGLQLDEIMRIPSSLSKIFEEDNPSGTHSISIVFKIPDDFQRKFKQAMDKGTARYLASHKKR
jgi:hypothetical protein